MFVIQRFVADFIIKIEDNKIYINNEIIEDYVSDFNINDFKLADIGYDKIPDNMYLVLGDNRIASLDSRSFGLIKKEDIIGRVVFRIWPLGKRK